MTREQARKENEMKVQVHADDRQTLVRVVYVNTNGCIHSMDMSLQMAERRIKRFGGAYRQYRYLMNSPTPKLVISTEYVKGFSDSSVIKFGEKYGSY